MKLPKQLKHWIKSAGLSQQNDRKWGKYFSHLKGHGFYWRIDATGLLCRSCKVENFDRWANSEDYELDFGENQKQFVERVKHLATLKEINP